jgi:hypothetical protein
MLRGLLATPSKAEATAEIQTVGILIDAVKAGDTNAAKFWLERRRGDDWGLKQRLEVSLRTEAERIAQEQGLNADELVREAERIASGRS